MKKALIYTAGILLGLLLVGYVIAQYFLGSLVRTGVNRMGPRITQSRVELADASVSPLSGAGTMSGLAVGNPAGWSGANALYVGKLRFAVQPRSLFDETIVINDLVIDQPEFTYETRLISSNIGDLMKNIEQAVGGRTDAADQSGRARKFIVKHVRLEHGKVTVGVGPAAIPLEVPAIELSDLGVAEGGLTSSQLAFAVLREVLPNILSATTSATGKLGSTTGAAAADAVKRAGESLQKWLGGKK